MPALLVLVVVSRIEPSGVFIFLVTVDNFVEADVGGFTGRGAVSERFFCFRFSSLRRNSQYFMHKFILSRNKLSKSSPQHQRTLQKQKQGQH